MTITSTPKLCPWTWFTWRWVTSGSNCQIVFRAQRKLGPVGRDLDSLFRHFKFRPSYPRPNTYYTIIFLWDLHKRKQLFNSGCINKTKSHFPMKNSHLAGVDSVPAKSADNTNNDFFLRRIFSIVKLWTLDPQSCYTLKSLALVSKRSLLWCLQSYTGGQSHTGLQRGSEHTTHGPCIQPC